MLASNSASTSPLPPKTLREVPSAIRNVFPEITLQSRPGDIRNALSLNPQKWGQFGFEISAEISPITTALNDPFLQIAQGLFIELVTDSINSSKVKGTISTGLITMLDAYDENSDNLRHFGSPKGTNEKSWNAMVMEIATLAETRKLSKHTAGKVSHITLVQGELFH